MHVPDLMWRRCYLLQAMQQVVNAEVSIHFVCLIHCELVDYNVGIDRRLWKQIFEL